MVPLLFLLNASTKSLTDLTIDGPTVEGLLHDDVGTSIADVQRMIDRLSDPHTEVFDPQQTVRANALKTFKVLLSVPTTADIAETKQKFSKISRLFERIITQEAHVILEVHYDAGWVGERDVDPEETLRQELQPDFEILRERLQRVVGESPPSVTEVRLVFVKDEHGQEQVGDGDRDGGEVGR